MTDRDDPARQALELQATGCEHLGSPTYTTILRGLVDDYDGNGISRELLHGRFDRPVHDAAPLRLLAALHAIVLRGGAPALAMHYPTAGGSPGPSLVRDVLAAISEHRTEIDAGLGRSVQTNEVGRAVVLLSLSHWLSALGVGEFDLIEVGASAGLNLNFDRYGATCGDLRLGDPVSPLQFGDEWFVDRLPLPASGARLVSRIGIDPDPIDPRDPDAALRLKSFLWPDHLDRMERLGTALSIHAHHPTVVERASADTWLSARSAHPITRCSVVYHSIVWQYMGSAVQDAMRDALAQWGVSATPDSPLIWARMEPAGPVADVRATIWTGHEPTEIVLAEVGYHGRGLRWLDRGPTPL